MKGYQNILVSIVVIIFASLSAYTTKIGFNLLWGGDDPTNKIIIPWAVAIGLSLFMVVLTSIIPLAIKNKKIPLLILVYSIIALGSMFFNFQGFFGRQTHNISLIEDAKSARVILTSINNKSDLELLNYYKLNKIQQEQDSFYARMQEEVDHGYQPGKGERYQGWQSKYLRTKNRLKTNKGNYSKDSLFIASNASEGIDRLNSALNSMIQVDLQLSISNAEIKQSMIVEKIKTLNNNFNPEIFKSESHRMEDPDYVLSNFLKYFSGDTLSEADNSRFALSIFFSFILDFPIFFSIVLLNFLGWNKENEVPKVITSEVPKENIKKSKNPFEDNFNSSEENKTDIDQLWQ